MSVTFTPSGTPASTLVMGAGPRGSNNGAMPAVDPANLDTTVQLTGTATRAWIAFSAAAQAGPDAPGSLELHAGIPMLLTNNPAVGASLFVIQGDRGASTATACTVVGSMQGGQVTITRGTVTTALTF